ncbi:MAG TPA: pectin acetylesterase-family hydrolase [Vitreimonas sp.]|uniref:pectin acetylesterase-family hydrolase n=1 Tax=Vitreimonas sp. TaxID=3069702 RepID=UPI002D266233|nr:pectin acetylesterase-family hydrolase [Vitreimonas sp.]HYD87975.1 pectin acetylesterase-family hydrolase [Vitreimonas sp.]
MRVLILAVALTLSACGGASLADATPVADPLPAEAGGWVEREPQSVTIDGETLEATCSDAPGADPAFKFWARRGVSNNLVVFFDGGGACWDNLTCSVPRLASGRGEEDGFYKAELIPGDDPSAMSGLFDLDNPRNPVRDWSFVFVPYCTGDVHSGSNTATYTDPDTGEEFKIEHRGADNFRIVLEWVRQNFAAPDQILVAGSSAGAYGAATHFARIREAFPGGRALMLGDAGQGVTTRDFLNVRNASWGYQLPQNVFGADGAITADEDIVGLLATHYPQDRFAQYTTAQDITQTAFYALMGVPQACRTWSAKMTGDLTRRQQAPNFRSYLASGQTHTILRSPLFYSQRSGGMPFAEWLAAALQSDAAGWANKACANCLRPPEHCQF